MFIGVLLLIMGMLLLFDKLGIIYGDFGDFIIPAALVALGIDMMVKHRREHK